MSWYKIMGMVNGEYIVLDVMKGKAEAKRKLEQVKRENPGIIFRLVEEKGK